MAYSATLLLLTACTGPKIITEYRTVEAVKVDTVIYMDVDTVNVEVPIDCPDQQTTIQNDKVKTDIKIKEGRLTVQTVKPVEVVRVTKIQENKEVVNKQAEPVKKSRAKDFFVWFGIITFAALSGYIVGRFHG